MEFVPLKKDLKKLKKAQLTVDVKAKKPRKKQETVENVTLKKQGKRNLVKENVIPVKKKRKKLNKESVNEESGAKEVEVEDNEKSANAGKKKSNLPGQTSRLFVKMREKIMNDTVVKDLHPDIISVRYPRKKCSRWCWAIFSSEEKAQKALAELKTRKGVIVREQLSEHKKEMKKKKKTEAVTTKKSMKKKIRNTWL